MSHNPFEGLSRQQPATSAPVAPAPQHTADTFGQNRDRAPSVISSLPLFNSPAAASWTAPATTPSPVASTTTKATEVDWREVERLRSDVGNALMAAKQAWESKHGKDHPMPASELAKVRGDLILRTVTNHAAMAAGQGRPIPPAHEVTLRRAIENSMAGLGRLQPLLEIDTAEDIWIVGTLPVKVVHANGHIETLPPIADSDDELTAQLHLMAANATPARAFDSDHFDMTINHQDRWRIHAISADVAGSPSIMIRQHRLTQISLGDLADKQLAPEPVLQFLDQAVQAGQTIIIAGDQGAGKTTLLRALLHAVPYDQRVGTLETDKELFLDKMPGREHTLSLVSRDGQGERDADGTLNGEVTVNDLVPMSLRQGLTRVVLGEVRGVEANAMFEAIRLGTGAMATIHSKGVSNVASRLAGLVALSGTMTIDQAMSQVAEGVDVVVFVRRRISNGQLVRFIEAIDVLEGMGDSDRPTTTEVYRANTWTGQPMTWIPPEDHTGELAQFRRPLDRLGAGQ